MPSCYVPGCKSGNGSSNSKNPLHIFKISPKADKETRQKWIQYIPKRVDKPWDFANCSICHLHFEEKFITKFFRVMLGNVVMAEVARKKWKLSVDAVPTLFKNPIVPQYYNRRAPPTRKPVKERATPTPKKKMKIVEEKRTNSSPIFPRIPLSSLGNRCYPPPSSIKNPSPLPSVTESSPQLELDHLDYENLEKEVSQDPLLAIDKLQQLRLPPGWLYQRWEDEEGISLQFCEVLKDSQLKVLPTFYTERTLQISSDNRAIAHIRNKNVSSSFPQRLSSVDDVENVIRKISAMKICGGVQNLNMVKSWGGAMKRMSVWFSEKCVQVIEEEDSKVMCKFCGELKSELRKVAEEWLKKKQCYRGKGILQRPSWMEEKVVDENFVEDSIPLGSKRIHVIVNEEEEGSCSTSNESI